MKSLVRERDIKIPDMESSIILFGNFDRNIKLIEDELDVTIIVRDTHIKIIGDETKVELAYVVIKKLLDIIDRGEHLDRRRVHYAISLVLEGREDLIEELGTEIVCISHKGKQVKCKTFGQKLYVNAIRDNDIVFGIGPAGTGKTYLAVAMAVAAFKAKEVNRIILTRPAVEAGEKLGFLPGDLQNKVDPYLRPLYDALFELLGPETYPKLVDSGIIEIAPLAYMRGRTLDDSFVILDEGQNTTPEQMKMFLTRLGVGSKAVITGDITQIDLPKNQESGLVDAIHVLEDIEGIEFIYLTHRDIVRHELVMKIVEAYDRYDKTRARLVQEGD